MAQESRFIAWNPVRRMARRDVCQERRCSSCCAGSIFVKGRGGPPMRKLNKALSKSARSCFRSLRSFSGRGERKASALPATSTCPGAGEGAIGSGPSRARTRSATAAQMEYSAGVKKSSLRPGGGSRSFVLRNASGTAPAAASNTAPPTVFLSRPLRDSILGILDQFVGSTTERTERTEKRFFLKNLRALSALRG